MLRSELGNPLLDLGQCATLACVLEATAPKVGNVHRGSDFDDLTFADFMASAVAIGPAMSMAAKQSVGNTVLAAVTATRKVVNTNTNLGIILLLSPLANAAGQMVKQDVQAIAERVKQTLTSLTPQDSRDVYAGIRLSMPGGMGKVSKMDVSEVNAPSNLLSAMEDAAERDLIAKQYVTNFALVFDKVLPYLLDGRDKGWSLTERIIRTQLRLLSEHPDSLIARKCGQETAEEISGYAGQVLSMGEPGDEIYHGGLADLDFWLRSDGHRRNPGTTADLIAAGLFLGLVTGTILPPYQ